MTLACTSLLPAADTGRAVLRRGVSAGSTVPHHPCRGMPDKAFLPAQKTLLAAHRVLISNQVELERGALRH
jgi:hypothetical protein